ncbi:MULTISPECIES: hypothetical protein [unclassified Sphingopyxis]|uniref:hypothetical protein n=1 Tax=unclassified Sphingopyxis TaxID=2614943 RepID=UPI00285AA2FC|nr:MULTISPECIES: hypothetical protein [unclassified Sphingopyxis]MDR6833541.1 hypothetical protein [Sphingopyxis sp. BE122]MDR7225810.1 hypothetical protein [Sphingopyxis sp. BE259]
MRFAFLIPPMMLLAACGQDEKAADSKGVSVHADGQVQISADKDGGEIRIDSDGVKIDLDIPDLGDMNINSDFDIDGVKLYPGSKIDKMDINASDKNGADTATVKFGFSSPAAPKVAADWMGAEFAKRNIQVQRTGTTLRGTDKDGDDFTISFAPDGANAKGEVVITKS